MGEEILRAGVPAGDHGTARCHGLGHHHREALLDARQHEHLRFAVVSAKVGVGNGTEELDLFGGQLGQQRLDRRIHAADQPEPLVGMIEAREGFQEIGHALAQGHVAHEEDLEAVPGRAALRLEAVQSSAIGDAPELCGRHAALDEGALRKARGDRDQVGAVILALLLVDDPPVDRPVVHAPAGMLLAHEAVLHPDMGGAAVAHVAAAQRLGPPPATGALARQGDQDARLAQRPGDPAVEAVLGEPGQFPLGRDRPADHGKTRPGHVERLQRRKAVDLLPRDAGLVAQLELRVAGPDAVETAEPFQLPREMEVVEPADADLHDLQGSRPGRLGRAWGTGRRGRRGRAPANVMEHG